MFKYNDVQLMITPPSTVIHNGLRRKFADLTPQEWDELGYNEAVPVERAPFTQYETQWIKGDDLIYREDVVSTTIDLEAKNTFLAMEIRAERDSRLNTTDWTQLLDCPLDDQDMILWQSYRQALRDVPDQPGFPDSVVWPEEPLKE